MVTCEANHRFQPASESPPESYQPPGQPPWMDAADPDRLSAPLREAMGRIIEPAYEHFVLDADDEMEKSLGMTLVHLMWLELQSQIDLARAHAEIGPDLALSDEYRQRIDRHMRLVGAKLRISSLLLRIQRSREAGGSGSSPLGGLLDIMAMHRAAMEDRQASYGGQTAGQPESQEPAPTDPSHQDAADEPAAPEQASQSADSARQTDQNGGQVGSSSGQKPKNADQHSSGQRRPPLPKPIRRGNLGRG